MAKDVEAGEHGAFPPKDYEDPPPAPLFDFVELCKWSFYRALIAEFTATLLFLYVTVLTVIGYKSQSDAMACNGVGYLGVAWAFGGMIFVLVYCTGGISGVWLFLFPSFFVTFFRLQDLVPLYVYRCVVEFRVHETFRVGFPALNPTPIPPSAECSGAFFLLCIKFIRSVSCIESVSPPSRKCRC